MLTWPYSQFGRIWSTAYTWDWIGYNMIPRLLPYWIGFFQSDAIR